MEGCPMFEYASAEWAAAQGTVNAATIAAGIVDKTGKPVIWSVTSDLLSAGSSNEKQVKQADGLRAAIIYMAPAGLAGDALSRNVATCTDYTDGCRDSCLNLAGKGTFATVKAARLGKAILFLQHRKLYLQKMKHEVTRLVRLAERDNLQPVLRANGTSDIPYECVAPWLYTNEDGTPTALQGYEYTKNLRRYMAYLNGKTLSGKPFPSNLTLTYSRDERTTASTIHEIISLGGSVAAVFRHKLPSKWLGNVVNDATANDWRWRDVPGTIQGLVALGPAVRDESGFVIDVPKVTPQVTDGYRYHLPSFVSWAATGRIR